MTLFSSNDQMTNDIFETVILSQLYFLPDFQNSFQLGLGLGPLIYHHFSDWKQKYFFPGRA